MVAVCALRCIVKLIHTMRVTGENDGPSTPVRVKTVRERWFLSASELRLNSCILSHTGCGPFLKAYVTPVYAAVGRRSIYQKLP